MARIELLVVGEDRIHQFIAVDQAQVALALLKTAAGRAVAVQGQEQPVFAMGQLAVQGRSVLVGHCVGAAFDLRLDDGRLDAQVVLVAITSTLGSFTRVLRAW